MNWDKLSFILRGIVRKEVLLHLNKPKTATMLSKELKTHRSTVSQILSILTDRGYTKCLDPMEPHNRYYELTDQGKKVVQKIQEEEL